MSAMRVTYVCHACMLVETHGVRILTDPWIHGPCFYGSWYQLPQPVVRIEDLFPLDYIYISHSHPDHLHKPTLARIPKDTQLIIPGNEPYQRGTLQSLGFRNILEVNHGATAQLKNGIRLRLYKQSWDSMIIVNDGKSTYLNLTDCRLEQVINEIRREFPVIDVAFLPFLDAMDYPSAFDLTPLGRSVTQREVDRRTAAHFINMALALNAKTAIPSASHKVFLHPSQWPMNDHISPLELAENCHRLAPQVNFLYLTAGDFWDSNGGSKGSPPPDAASIQRDVKLCYKRRMQEVDEGFNSYSAVPTPQHTAEIQGGLKKLFETKLHKLSWFWRILLGLKFEFACPELEKPYQLVDVRRAWVSEPQAQRFPEADVTFTLPSGILDYTLIQDKDLWNDARTSNRIYTRLNKPVSVARVKLFGWLLTWHFIEKGLFNDMIMRLTWPLVCKYHFGRYETVKRKDLQLFDDGAPATEVAAATD
jgi:L-ascorbate metabolism protein UlaG (beta-lactamase superfamily)